MKKIGITGGIACGKSFVLNIIKDLGYEVDSCDEIFKNIFFETKDFLDKWGVDFKRSALKEKFLNDSEFRIAWCDYVDPKILKILFESVNQIAEVPLLFEKKLEKSFEKIWTIYVPKDVQIARLMNSRNYSLEQAEQIISLQLDIEYKKSNSNLIIDGTLPKEEITKIIQDNLCNKL